MTMALSIRARMGIAIWLMPGLILLAPRSGAADALTAYQLQVIAQAGHQVNGFTALDGLRMGALNDAGQLAFVTDLPPGDGEALVQWSAGTFTPIARAKGPAPAGLQWPVGLDIYPHLEMNQAGDIAFVPKGETGVSGTGLGAYLWTYKTGVVSPIWLSDASVSPTRAGTGIPLNGGGASLNNQGEIAFAGYVKGADNKGYQGILLSRPGGEPQGVALPGDPLPGPAGAVLSALRPSIDDAGQVAFDAIGTQASHYRAYLWENGDIQLVAGTGTELPGLGAINDAYCRGLNRKNGSLLLSAAKPGASGLFLWKDGQFTPVAVQGQEMPGGGQFAGEPVSGTEWGVWPANDAGQHAFMANVKENGRIDTAAYLVDMNGVVSLILKTGMTTNLGTITAMGSFWNAMGLNNQGQVALVAQIDKGPDTLLLLTPRTP